MAPVPKKVSTIRFLPRFGNKAGVEGDNALTLGPDGVVEQLPVEGDRIKRFRKLTRVGLFREVAIAAQIAEIGLAAHHEKGRKQRQQKVPLGFGDGESIEYLFCQVHECRLSV